jgi:hypothetical protein
MDRIIFLEGIISEYILVSNDSEANKKSSMLPLHLGMVIPAEIIQKFLTSSKSREQKEKVQKKYR